MTTLTDPQDNWLWIIGPGAIGRLLAATLATARQKQLHEHGTSSLPRVLLLGRQIVNAPSITLNMTTPESLTVSIEITYSTLDTLQRLLPCKPSAIWLTTKAHAVQAVWQQLAAHITPDTPITCWQNGLSAQPWLAERHSNLLCASTTEGAWLPPTSSCEPASTTASGIDVSADPQPPKVSQSTSAHCLAVQHAGRGQTWLGTWSPDGKTSPSQCVCEQGEWLNAAGIACTTTTDIQTRLWHKLAINAAINPLVARFRIRNGQLRDRPFSPMVRQAVTEISTVLHAEGIAAPTGGWQALVDQVIRATCNNRASMLQDVLAGRTTEVEAILGPLRCAADRHGLTLPLLDALYHHLDEQQP